MKPEDDVTDSLEHKLGLAMLRERKARARTARLRRTLDRTNRRTRNQAKYTLGAAMLALAESGKGEQLIAGVRRWLAHYLTRDEDRRALRHTAFALDVVDGGNDPV